MLIMILAVGKQSRTMSLPPLTLAKTTVSSLLPQPPPPLKQPHMLTLFLRRTPSYTLFALNLAIWSHDQFIYFKLTFCFFHFYSPRQWVTCSSSTPLTSSPPSGPSSNPGWTRLPFAKSISSVNPTRPSCSSTSLRRTCQLSWGARVSVLGVVT